MYHFGKRILAALCAGTMLLATPAFAMEPTPDTDYTVNPELEQFMIQSAFYDIYGWENAVPVYYNGTALAFPDAQPLAQQGTTFVPIRTFADALGATTGYDDKTQTVTLTKGDNVVSFVIGSADVDVDGTVTTLPVPTFALENRTYVPLRLISAAYGLDVTWSSLYHQVAINDMDALTAGLDTDYTIANSLLAYSSTMPTQNVGITGTMDITYDDGHGTTVTANSDMEIIVDKDLKSMSYQMDNAVDLGTLEQTLKTLVGTQGDAETSALLDTMLGAVKEFQVSYIIDITTFDIYLQCDLLPILSPFILGNVADTDLLAGNPWIKISYADLLGEEMYNTMMTQMNGIMDQVTTTNYTMKDLVTLMMGDATNPAEASTYAVMAQILPFLKDDAFTATGTGYQSTYSVAGLNVMFNINQNDEGVVTDYTFTADCTDLTLAPDFTLTTDFDMSQTTPTASDFTWVMTLNMGAYGTLNLNMDFTSACTDKEPLTATDALDFMELAQALPTPQPEPGF